MQPLFENCLNDFTTRQMLNDKSFGFCNRLIEYEIASEYHEFLKQLGIGDIVGVLERYYNSVADVQELENLNELNEKLPVLTIEERESLKTQMFITGMVPHEMYGELRAPDPHSAFEQELYNTIIPRINEVLIKQGTAISDQDSGISELREFLNNYSDLLESLVKITKKIFS